MRDRRAVFFTLAALVCLALVPIAGAFAWVAWATAAVYGLLALGSLIETFSRRQH